MKVHTATFIASSVSALSLIVCLFAIAQIYNDVQSIWAELDEEISTFRDTTNDLWSQMISMGKKRMFRLRRSDEYAGGSSSNAPSKPSYEGGPAGERYKDSVRRE